MLGPQKGMGPIFWQDSIEKCSERHVDPCADMDGCCAIVPCSYCLELVDSYLDEIYYGTATFDGTSWVGSVNGYDFVAYWERGYESDVCEFVVLFNNEEVFRSPCCDASSCYETFSCRDSSGSEEVSADYTDYTLTWTRLEHQPLKYVVDDSGCKTWFCGTCECTCAALCATLVTPEGDYCTGFLVLLGSDNNPVRTADPWGIPSVPSSTNACPPNPLNWTGTLVCDYVSHEISISLSRDDYTGGCILGGSAGSETLDPTEVSDCMGLLATWELYDGTIITVQCLECGECGGANNNDEPCVLCPEGTLYPYHVDITFPTLGLTVPSINAEDPDEFGGGWPTFRYRVEGDYMTTCGLTSFQSEFGMCSYNLAFTDISESCICGDSASVNVKKRNMEIVSCDPLVIIVNGRCVSPTSVPVIITGSV